MREYIFSQWADCFSENDEIRHSIKFRVKLISTIDIKKMESCVNIAIKRFPYFSVRLCSDGLSLFFEYNEKSVPVFLRGQSNLEFGSNELNFHYMFFTIKNDWLIFDISHILTDGIGAKRFLKFVLFLYCREHYDSKLSCSESMIFNTSISQQEVENPLEKIPILSNNNYNFGNFYIQEPLQITNLIQLDFRPTLYRLKIKESEVMNIIESESGTPNVLFSLLLNKAINAIMPDKVGIRSLICVDSRKYLKVPYAHQNLITCAMLPYYSSFEDMPLRKQLLMLKGLLNFETINEKQNAKIQQNLFRHKFLSQQLTLYDKFIAFTQLPVINEDLATNTISYIRNEGWDCIEKYISDCSIISTLFTDISIELTILNGYFYIDFYQKFSTDDFYKAFVKQLERINLNYIKIETSEIKVCRNRIPNLAEYSEINYFDEKNKILKISEHKLFEPLLQAIEKNNFSIVGNLLSNFKTKPGNMEKYYLDRDSLNYICAKLSNPLQQIPFFVILFLILISTPIYCDYEKLQCSEIMYKFLNRLMQIKGKFKILRSSDFKVIIFNESVLCVERPCDSKKMYIIVNNSEEKTNLTMSELPYWIELFSGERFDYIKDFECRGHEFYLLYHVDI